MNKRTELINKLSKLGMEENFIKRQIDANFFNFHKRQMMFDRLKEVKIEIIKVKKELNEERKKINENSNTN